MSYISVFLTHNLPSFRDTNEALTRLRPTEAPCREVSAYWGTVQPYDRNAMRWTAEEVLEDCVHYAGPGSLWLDVTPRAARIHTGGRWRGFLSILPLRRVHLAAFRAIAAALGSETMAISHDSIEKVHEIFWAGATQSACVAALQAALGLPQASIEAIEARIVALTEHTVPDVWYLERVSEVASTTETG
jgi:hypothetical protein